MAALYIVIGLLWVNLGDKLLHETRGFLEFSHIPLLSSMKGTIYVLLTGWMLYQLIDLHGKRLLENEKQSQSYFEDNPDPMWT